MLSSPAGWTTPKCLQSRLSAAPPKSRWKRCAAIKTVISHSTAMTKIVSPAAPSIWRAPQKVYQKFPLSSKASHNAEKMCWKVLRKWTKKPINHLLTVWENLLKSTPNTVWRKKTNPSFRRFTRIKAVKTSLEHRQKSSWQISTENTNSIRIRNNLLRWSLKRPEWS